MWDIKIMYGFFFIVFILNVGFLIIQIVQFIKEYLKKRQLKQYFQQIEQIVQQLKESQQKHYDPYSSTSIKPYRKKPIIIYAVQWVWDNWGEICNFVPVPEILYVPDEEKYKEFPSLRIKTLEGEQIVSYRDYIIKGIKGEYYAIKPDIFEETYERVYEIPQSSAVSQPEFE